MAVQTPEGYNMMTMTKAIYCVFASKKQHCSLPAEGEDVKMSRGEAISPLHVNQAQ